MQTGGVRGERGLGDAATGNWQEDNSLGCPRSHAHESQRLHDATNSSYKSRYRTIRRRSVHSATSDRPQPQEACTTALDIPCRRHHTAHQATPTRMCPPPDNASRAIAKQSNPGIVHRERVNRTAHATASASAGCARNHYCQTQCVAVTTRQLPPKAEAQSDYTLRMRTQIVTPQEHTDAAERTHSERGHVRTFSANSSRTVSTLWKPRSTKSPRNR